MPSLPRALRVEAVRSFDENSAPRERPIRERTRPDAWGRIVVLTGFVRYESLDLEAQSWILRPGVDGIIAPNSEYRVAACGQAQFRLEFLEATKSDAL
jgi:tellurite resistance-related uncharacterized protein